MRISVLLLVYSFLFAFSPRQAIGFESGSESLNIVILLADDLGWTGLRCFGSDFYETPNLDQLANSGMKFTNAYAACTVCSPTRASIMTGLYPARMHLTDFIAGQNRPFAKLNIPEWNKGLDHSYSTIAEALEKKGYVTAHVGKWHLDRAGKRNEDDGPKTHGFQFTYTRPAGTRGYKIPATKSPEGKPKGQYLTDYLTDQACKFIDETKDKPFFLYFAYHTPHTPIQGREDLVAYFQSRVKPDAIHNNPVYAAMVKSLDQSVGRILNRLEEHGIADNTLVIFTSDNGGLTQRYGKHDGFTENLPLRRGKGSAYEGGVRVPTIVRWPGVTPASSTCNQPVMSIDWFPTVMETCGETGGQFANRKFDGVSLVPQLKDPATDLDRDLFWHYPHYHAGGDGPYSAIRSGNLRLIQFHEDEKLELYDLSNDIGEQKNLALQQPAVAKQMLDRLLAWRNAVGAQMPTENPAYDQAKATQVVKQSKQR